MDMITPTKYFLIVFAILTIIGGIIGYAKAGSMVSIVAGGIAGILLLVSFFLLPHQPVGGLVLGLVVSILLAIRFVPILLGGGSFMPAGLMSLLSVLGIIMTALSLFKK